MSYFDSPRWESPAERKIGTQRREIDSLKQFEAALIDRRTDLEDKLREETGAKRELEGRHFQLLESLDLLKGRHADLQGEVKSLNRQRWEDKEVLESLQAKYHSIVEQFRAEEGKQRSVVERISELEEALGMSRSMTLVWNNESFQALPALLA